MALQRDRGYLWRLSLLLVAAGMAAAFLFAGLTGASFASCVSEMFVGAPPAEEPAPPVETNLKQ